MKSKFLLVFFVLLLVFVSCKKDAVNKKGAYPEIVVGTAQGKTYTVVSDTIIKPEWEKALRQKGNKSEITSFEIVHSVTQGDSAKDFVMLIAKCNDSRTTMAALLVEKGDEFFFDKKAPITIICSGECTGGCLPLGNYKDGAVSLMCSSCADCVKTDYSLNFP